MEKISPSVPNTRRIISNNVAINVIILFEITVNFVIVRLANRSGWLDDTTCNTLIGPNAITYEGKMNRTNTAIKGIDKSFKKFTIKLAIKSSIFLFI